MSLNSRYKIIILIIDHTAALKPEDNDPTNPAFKGSYLNLLNGFKASWRKYMNHDPDILCLFLGVNSSFAENQYLLNLQTNTFTVRGQETNKTLNNYQQNNSPLGILRKTLSAMTHINQLFTYDYVIRTNLSCFFNLPKLKETVLRQRKYQFFGGALCKEIKDNFVSGGMQIYSKDACIYMTTQTKRLEHSFTRYEDILCSDVAGMKFGTAEVTKTFCFTDIPYARTFSTEKQLDDIICRANKEGYFYFRIKNANGNKNREYDLMAHARLYHLIYEDNVSVSDYVIPPPPSSISPPPSSKPPPSPSSKPPPPSSISPPPPSSKPPPPSSKPPPPSSKPPPSSNSHHAVINRMSSRLFTKQN